MLTWKEIKLQQELSTELVKSSNDSFEDTFANVAYSYLQEKAIKLIPYLVGFETVERNDEGTKAIGLFGFKVGDRYIYTPVFFSNAQIKPLELLYIKDEDLFVPLDEDWVGYLLKQAPVELGEPSNDLKRKQPATPNFESFATPPRTGRYLSASTREDSAIPDWLARFGPKAQETLLHTMKKSADFCRAMSEYTDLRKVMDVCRKGILEHAKSAAPRVNSQRTAISLPEDANDPEYFKSLPKDDKKALREGKTVVHDLRPSEEVSKLYDAQYFTRYSNPVKSGVYRVIDINGNLTECLVLLAPKSLCRMYASDGATVIELSTGKWTACPVERIWVRDSSFIDDMDKLFAQTKKLGSGEIGDCYLFINKMLQSSVPFMIAAKNRDSNGVASYRLRPMEMAFPRNSNLSQIQLDRLETGKFHAFGSAYPDDIVHPVGVTGSRAGVMSSESACDISTPSAILSPKQEGSLRHLGSGLVVPQNFTMWKLKKPKNRNDILHLGDSGALKFNLCEKGVQELMISANSGDYYVSVGDFTKAPMRKRAALQYLMHSLGIHGSQALDLVEDADDGIKTACLVKLAQGFAGPLQGIPIPDPMIGPDTGAAQGFQYFNEELVPLHPEHYPVPEPIDMSETNIYDGPPNLEETEMATDLAMQAAGTGQQEVFDHAVLGTLAKTTQTSDLIQSYIPDLQTALDKLGRVLYLLWSKPEDFKDLYGIAQLAEAEDKIRNVFRNLGEVLLELKSKESNRLDLV